jgi:ribosomal protein S19
VTRSLKKNPFVANNLLKKINKLTLGERRELNPRMVDSQSTALIHLATSAPLVFSSISIFLFFH